MAVTRIPPGTVVNFTGVEVTVWGYVDDLKCYRVTYAGPGFYASASELEHAYDEQRTSREA